MPAIFLPIAQRWAIHHYIFFATCLLCMVTALLMEKMEERGKYADVFRMNIALHVIYLAITAAVVISYLVVYGNRFL